MRPSALLVIGVALLSSCANSTEAPATEPLGNAPSTGNWTLSKPIWSTPPENTEGGPPHVGRDNQIRAYSWYTNSDLTLWMMDLDRVSGKPIKTAWFRPRDSQLVITGRRLDADAPPLIAEVPPAEQYPRRMFTPTRITFPTDGIWEVTGKAGNSELRRVVRVPSTAPTKPPA